MSSFRNIQKTIEGFGLSQKEALVYVKMLVLGNTTIAKITTATQLPRSSCYNILDELLNRGLVNEVRTSTRNLYKAADPESFFAILREREASLKEILPELKARFKKNNSPLTACFYEGTKGIKNIFDDILSKQYPILATTSIEDAGNVLGDDFTDFISQRQQKHLPVKLLTYRSPASLRMKRDDESELRLTRFLPKTLRFKTANFVYGDCVAVISLRNEKPFGLIIEDDNIAKTYRIFFELLWDQSFG